MAGVKDAEGNILYDVWVANVDMAAVFQTQTTINTGVGMIQNYFCPLYEGKEELEVLAAALQEAFRDRPDAQDDMDSIDA